MVTQLSMGAARQEAERLRLIRRHASDLPPGDRDALHAQLDTASRTLAGSQLLKG